LKVVCQQAISKPKFALHLPRFGMSFLVFNTSAIANAIPSIHHSLLHLRTELGSEFTDALLFWISTMGFKKGRKREGQL
jgi:hypothetical protein